MSSTKSTRCAVSRKNVLTSEDVCSIIRACSESGVMELEFQDLHIVLGKQAKPPQDSIGAGVTEVIPTPEPQIKEQDLPPDELLKQEIQAREEQLAQMMLEDPAEAERLQLEGDLSDDEPGTNEE